MIWKTVKLGDVLKTGAGGTPLKSKKQYYENGNVSWLLSGAICQKEITSSPTFITKLGLEKSSAKIFPPNTVLVAMYGATAGQVGILRFPSSTNQAVCGIYPNENYSPEFLYYYLLNYKDKLLEEVSGVAQPNLSQIKIKNIRIPLLTIAEQQRIVAKIDAVFSEINKAITLTKEKKIEEKNIKLSSLKSIFSINASQKTIGEIATVIAGQSPEGKYYNKNGKGIPFYQGKKEFGNYKLKQPNVWTTKTTKISLKGDILLSVRAPVGETNINQEKICIGRGLAAIRPNKENNQEFIYYFLNSIKNEIVGNVGAVFNSINKKQIEDIIIPVPSFEEQIKIVNKIKSIFSLLDKINLSTKKKLDNLNILKISVIKQNLKYKSV